MIFWTNHYTTPVPPVCCKCALPIQGVGIEATVVWIGQDKFHVGCAPRQSSNDDAANLRRIAELERMLRPGASAVLNEIIAAGFAHINPVTNDMSLTLHGAVVVERAKADMAKSKISN